MFLGQQNERRISVFNNLLHYFDLHQWTLSIAQYQVHKWLNLGDEISHFSDDRCSSCWYSRSLSEHETFTHITKTKVSFSTSLNTYKLNYSYVSDSRCSSCWCCCSRRKGDGCRRSGWEKRRRRGSIPGVRDERAQLIETIRNGLLQKHSNEDRAIATVKRYDTVGFYRERVADFLDSFFLDSLTHHMLSSQLNNQTNEKACERRAVSIFFRNGNKELRIY